MRTLIVYFSKNGFTEQAVNLLKDRIEGDVEAMPCIKDFSVDLTKFDNIIVGTPVYYGKMNSMVLDFCINYQEMLKSKRLGIFSVGGDEATALENVLGALPKELVEHAVAKSYFGYGFNFERMGFFDRFVARKAAKKTASEIKFNLEAINAFSVEFNRVK